MSVRPAAAWKLYLSAGALGTALYLLVPPLQGSGPVMNVLGLSGVIAILVGIRRHRPPSRAPWLLFVVGLALFWLGDVYTYSYPKLFHHEVGFPSAGDALYLAVYPVLLAGLVWLVRRRNPHRDRGGMIDSAILTLGLALPSWNFLIAPYLHDDTLALIPKLVSIAYPLGDILLLAAAIRLAMDRGRRQPAFYLLVASLGGLLVTDFVYGVLLLEGAFAEQLSLDIGWIAFYVLWGAAALHPSMCRLDEPSSSRGARLTPLRLVLLAGASCTAPAISLAEEHTNVELLVTSAAAIALFGLVVWRMAGLVRRQEQWAARERVLAAAGAALVGARTRDEMTRAALAAVPRLLGAPATALLCLSEEHDLRVVARSDAATAPERAALSDATTAWILRRAAEPEHRAGAEPGPAVRRELGLPHDTAGVVVLGLQIRGDIRGALVVGRDAVTSAAVEAALRALATQLALALESATLTEHIHARRSEARFASLVKHATDLITVVGADATVLYQSPSSQRVLGYAPEELVGTRFDRLVPPGDQSRLLHVLADGSAYVGHEDEPLACTLLHRDGSVRHFEILHTNLLDDEDVRGIVLNSRDVSERKAFEEQLTHQAFHDPVTALPNRALFVERVRHAISLAKREGSSLAVIFLDLDDFKTINDSLGHAAGDHMLLAVAKRLATSVRASDTAARFGGDEFAILLEDITGADEAAEAVERITETIQAPLSLAGKELMVRASMGIAVLEPGTSADADELIRDADAAMYIAKRDGKGGYRLFEPAMHHGVLARLELRADLQRALSAHEFELHFQPIVRLDSGVIVGVEALLRWHHPTRGLVLPDQFVAFGEETGLIVPIGSWVLHEACRQAILMQRAVALDPPLSMSVNLSVKQLQHADVVADVRAALTDSGLEPSQLTVEITESVLMTDTELAIRRLEDLRDLGVRVAMDDFGTGYSSLSYLSRFPIDVLKMDRSFLRAGANPAASGLASAVVALGATLSLDVVAEGIELNEQRLALRDLGCDLGQGFYFARPMSANDTIEHLRTYHPTEQAAGQSP